MEINYLYHTWTLGISSNGLSKAFVYLALPFVKTIFSLSTLQPFCHLYVHTKLVTLTNIYNLNGKWLLSDIFECKLQEMGTGWRTFKRGIQVNFLCNMKNNKQTFLSPGLFCSCFYQNSLWQCTDTQSERQEKQKISCCLTSYLSKVLSCIKTLFPSSLLFLL